EMLAFGKKYTAQVVRNAKALASSLHEEGINVLGEGFGFTESHTIIADTTKYGLGGDLEKKLERANIILNRNLLPYDLRHDRHFTNPGGIRLGSLEVTRLGMKEDDMKEIARLIARVIVKGEDPVKVREDVKEFRRDFQEVDYCFESARLAHEFLRFE
ncbi:MAG: serine hydroxymethyltransferase, partial [Candidatus Geothermarchaeales archaeon]